MTAHQDSRVQFIRHAQLQSVELRFSHYRQHAFDKPISYVAAEVGFADQSYFTRKFKSLVGATPRQYQMAGR